MHQPSPVTARRQRTRDFTIDTYLRLLDAFMEQGYTFQTFSGFLASPAARTVLLRHDVDDRKLHSLAFAQLQHDRGITGTYYFRMVPRSFDPAIIREVHAMGHEVGYHYEEMDTCRGDAEQAFALFQRNLATLRELVPITSICMHGSPRSPFDNRSLWDTHDYRALGIMGEPYFDLDTTRVTYLTDTGRRWDGGAYSVRDHMPGPRDRSYHHTTDIVHALRQGRFPAQAMLTFHPQRWTDSPTLWMRDSLVQRLKNQAKFGLIQWRSFKRRRSTRSASA
jgi:hypothetical protein